MPYALWRIKTDTPTVYLTFDDGPTPGVTELVLQFLKESNSQATFFCLGKQAEAYPDLMQATFEGGHTIGNHTYSHINGWNVPFRAYLDDIFRAEKAISGYRSNSISLFRPPYGRMKLRHWLALRPTHQCCMWDVTGQDFLEELDSKQVVDNVLQNTTDGSIVLLHDSDLAAPRVLGAIPEIIAKLRQRGFALKAIDSLERPG